MLDTLIFAFASFWGAFLLFAIQPMAGKAMLPLLGGSSQVWITCLVFFQALLLCGYVYAHFIVAALSRAAHIAVHAALAAATLTALPLALASDRIAAPEGEPIAWLLSTLAAAVGAPVLLVASSAPLIQRWFSLTTSAAAGDPYFLYAASNLGSLLALLAYPLVIEPRLDLGDQATLWTLGYIGLLAAHAACLWTAAGRERNWSRPRVQPDFAGLRPKWSERLMWLALAFVPSSLLLGVTSYITTDLLSAPLFWVAPLALYLVTFILAFARSTTWFLPWASPLQLVAMMALLLVTVWPPLDNFVIAIGVHLATFFLSCLMCHGELARRRPPAIFLTEYYFWLSLGGALGGMFNALAAPLLFDGVYEYPIALVLACFLRPGLWLGAPTRRLLDFAVPAVVAAGLFFARDLTLLASATGGWVRADARAGVLLAVWIVAIAALAALRRRPLAIGLIVAAAFAMKEVVLDERQRLVLEKERSFYGVLRVERHAVTNLYFLEHGTTTHGSQSHARSMTREPLTYYFRSGPFGDVFNAAAREGRAGSVAIIGLGAGSLACLGRPGEQWTFYEIDPLVERFARDARYFTFLRDCDPNKRVVIGDARLSLRDAPPASFDVIVVDAFTSDSIPVHLLTREALRLYLGKLAPNGLIAFHISHRVLDLAPIVGRLASDAGLVGRLKRQRVMRTDLERVFGYAVDVAVVARSESALGPIARNGEWSPIPERVGEPVWTDAYSSPLSAISTRRLLR